MKKSIGILIVMLVLIAALSFGNSENDQVYKIGVITDLSGGAAYWGESTQAGIDILKNELGDKSPDFIVEDYALDPAKAASAAQKLLNIDKVDAVYAEFNPGAIAAASVLAGKDTPFIYDAAVTSPLQSSNLFFKTYLDYEEGCRLIAQKLYHEGVNKIGLLKVNLEFGQLCENGLRAIYGDSVISEGYNLGDTDFRTLLLKIRNSGAGAVVNVGFEGDTANTLKVLKSMRYTMIYGTVDDTISAEIRKDYPDQLKGAWTFGFSDISPAFLEKLKAYKVSSPYGAAIAYTHLKQLATELEKCGSDHGCIAKNLEKSGPDSTIGFKEFNGRIADLSMKLKKY